MAASEKTLGGESTARLPSVATSSALDALFVKVAEGCDLKFVGTDAFEDFYALQVALKAVGMKAWVHAGAGVAHKDTQYKRRAAAAAAAARSKVSALRCAALRAHCTHGRSRWCRGAR